MIQYTHLLVGARPLYIEYVKGIMVIIMED